MTKRNTSNPNNTPGRVNEPNYDEQGRPNIETAVEDLIIWFAALKRRYQLQEGTLLNLLNFQLTFARDKFSQPPSGQELIDAIAAEALEKSERREADEVIEGQTTLEEVVNGAEGEVTTSD